MSSPGDRMFDQSAPLFREAFRLVEELEGAGYQAYVVGGSVRDAMLGRPVHDVDIATSATPAEVQRLFPRTVATGLKYGTVTVVTGRYTFEVTTFRREGPYGDARHPDFVQFAADVTDDLARRDFTINAMAVDFRGVVTDPFDGQKDLQRKVIRCVGDPRERFREDALRMLRAARFAAQLGFDVSPATIDAIKAERKGLAKLAVERITGELHKILSAVEPGRALRLLWSACLIEEIAALFLNRFPASPPRNQLASLEAETDVYLRWILFLRLCGVKSSEAQRVCRELKLPRKWTRELSLLWREGEKWSNGLMSNADVRRTVFAHGLKRSLRIVRLAYRFGRLSRREEQLWRRRFRHADWEMPLDDPSQLALDGRALMQISGREPGPWIGRVLDTLLDKVVSGEVINHPSRLEKEWRLHGPHAP